MDDYVDIYIIGIYLSDSSLDDVLFNNFQFSHLIPFREMNSSNNRGVNHSTIYTGVKERFIRYEKSLQPLVRL